MWTFDGLLSKSRFSSAYNISSDSAGFHFDYTKNTLVAEYNDCDSVKELLITIKTK